MSTNVIQPSFAVGELSPALYGRVDYAKYRIGAATMRNFFVDYRGGSSTRTGTKFVGKARNSTASVRMIPFQFSSEIAYALEFGQYYMRVIKNGEYILETPFRTTFTVTKAAWAVVNLTAHGFTALDQIYFVAVVGMIQLNLRVLGVSPINANSFHLLDELGRPLDSSSFGAFVSGFLSPLYTMATPYAGADLHRLNYIQSADVVTIVHPNYQPRELSRTADNVWTLTPISFQSKLSAPTGLDVTATNSDGFQVYAYRITALTSDGDESNPSIKAQVISVNIAGISGSIKAVWNRVQGANYYYVYKAGNFPAATKGTARMPPGVAYGFAAITYSTEFNDGNIVPDFSLQPPQHKNPFAPGQIVDYIISNPGHDYTYDGTTAIITDPTGFGAVLLPVVNDGKIEGFVIEDAGQNYSLHPVLSIVVFGGHPGAGFVGSVQVGPQTGVYPGAACYFQQRLMFGGTANKPQTIWGSKPGIFHNFDSGNPVNDGDALNITLASQQVNTIRSMIPMPGGLVAFTSGGVWQVSAGQGNVDAPITPLSVTATPQAYSGASTVTPIPINYNILYVQDAATVVRELRYQFSYSIYVTTDISVHSSHLFNNHQVVEWAYASDPFKIVWAIRNDGVLLSLTYLPEQELLGWARHDTFGEFESVCAVQEGDLSAVYAVVKRTVNNTDFRYIERFAPRTFPYGVEDAWAVDCGLNLFQFTPNAELSPVRGEGTSFVVTVPGIFVSGDVGKVIRAGGGIGTITVFSNSQVVTVRWDQPITDVLLDQNGGGPKAYASGTWTMTRPVARLSGLWHLEGLEVSILGDGNVFPPQVVTDGQIVLPTLVSKVVVGLGFQAQLQTLKLDAGEPTIQGKRKKIAAASIRVLDTRGLAIGPDFDHLTEIKERTNEALGVAIPLQTRDERLVLSSSYNTDGQVAVQQDYPLPATILAIIPEIVLGDTP